MNTQRLVVLGLALVAAAGAAFLVRSMLGGGPSFWALAWSGMASIACTLFVTMKAICLQS